MAKPSKQAMKDLREEMKGIKRQKDKAWFFYYWDKGQGKAPQLITGLKAEAKARKDDIVADCNYAPSCRGTLGFKEKGEPGNESKKDRFEFEITKGVAKGLTKSLKATFSKKVPELVGAVVGGGEEPAPTATATPKDKKELKKKTSYSSMFSAQFKGGPKAFLRRKEKLEAELSELGAIIDEWKQRDNAGWTTYQERKETMERLLAAAQEEAEKGKPKKAYAALESVKSSARKAVSDCRKGLDNLKETGVLLGGRPVIVDGRSLPGVDDLPMKRQEGVIKEVARKVTDGQALVSGILAGDNDRDLDEEPPSRQEIADAMWYLKSLAEMSASEAHVKGAMTIPDPDNKLQKFFDKCGEVYTRMSSHLTGAQGQDQERGTGRGIDFYEGGLDPDTQGLLLPYGMNTLLYHAFDIEHPDGSSETRLYLKMETEGARMFTPDGDASDPTSRDRRWSDYAGSAMHGYNWVKAILGKRDDMGMSAHREQVPKDLAKSYDAMLDATKEDPAKRANKLLQRNLQDRPNINTMVDNALELAERFDMYVPGADSPDSETQTAYCQVVATYMTANEKFTDGLRQHFGSDDLTDEGLRSRMGGEVVLTAEELGQGAAPGYGPGTGSG